MTDFDDLSNFCKYFMSNKKSIKMIKKKNTPFIFLLKQKPCRLKYCPIYSSGVVGVIFEHCEI